MRAGRAWRFLEEGGGALLGYWGSREVLPLLTIIQDGVPGGYLTASMRAGTVKCCPGWYRQARDKVQPGAAHHVLSRGSVVLVLTLLTLFGGVWRFELNGVF